MELTKTLLLKECNTIKVPLPETIDLRIVKPELYIYDASHETELNIWFDIDRVPMLFHYAWGWVPVKPGEKKLVSDWTTNKHWNFNIYPFIKDNITFFSRRLQPTQITFQFIWPDVQL